MGSSCALDYYVSSLALHLRAPDPFMQMKSLILPVRTDRFSLCSYSITILHTQAYDCNPLSIGQTSSCRENNKMTWWQAYFTAKVCWSSPLISLFLFFLSVISQEANKDNTFSYMQVQWQGSDSKRKLILLCQDLLDLGSPNFKVI